jgi:simple sugar transport system permease protein
MRVSVNRVFSLFRNKRVLGIVSALAAFVIILYLIEQAGMKSDLLVKMGVLAMTPLALAAVGECINEKAGTINIGLEGIFGITAIVGVLGAELFRSGAMGLLVGALVGALIGFLFAIVSIYGKADQIVAGMGINIFAIGLVGYLLMFGYGMPYYKIPAEFLVSPIYTPWGSIHPITLVAIGVAIMGQIFLYKTLLGLRIRAAGEAPESVDVAGSSVNRIRIFASTVGGGLCGLGGAFITIAWFGFLTRWMVAGKGFIALACVVFAGLEPLLALGAAFIFGFTEGLASWIAITPGVKEVVPFYFINMIPYIATLVIITIAIGRRRFPRAIGKPYVRE